MRQRAQPPLPSSQPWAPWTPPYPPLQVPPWGGSAHGRGQPMTLQRRQGGLGGTVILVEGIRIKIVTRSYVSPLNRCGHHIS
jgi:hypothetical protein